MTSLQHRAVDSIRHSFQVLSQTKDLSPRNDDVTTCLTTLVRTLTQCHSPKLVEFLLTTPELKTERENLPVLCGQAECEMEKFWARKLIEKPACNLTEFWYYPEYLALCRAEMGLFREREFSRISFLGSGALPLTAFMLAQHNPKTEIVCVDFDHEAAELSQKLATRIGLANQVSVQCMDALEYTPVAGELVICASLLNCKEAVYSHLDGFDCALIVRDAEGPYQYLYKAAEPPPAPFVQQAKTSMNGLRINTSRYYERCKPVTHAAF